MILIFGALLAVYVFCRAILPLKLKWGWKLLLAALLAVAAFKFHLLHLFGGPMFFSPVLPENVLLAAAWLFSVLFLFFFLLLAASTSCAPFDIPTISKAWLPLSVSTPRTVSVLQAITTSFTPRPSR